MNALSEGLRNQKGGPGSRKMRFWHLRRIMDPIVTVEASSLNLMLEEVFHWRQVSGRCLRNSAAAFRPDEPSHRRNSLRSLSPPTFLSSTSHRLSETPPNQLLECPPCRSSCPSCQLKTYTQLSSSTFAQRPQWHSRSCRSIL